MSAPPLRQQSDVDALAEAIRRINYLRRTPRTIGGEGGHTEWFHFCVQGEDLDLIVNFSLRDDVRRGVEGSAEIARVTLLVRRGAEWDGDIDSFSSAQTVVLGGQLQLVFDSNELRYHEGLFHLSVAMRDRPLSAELTLRPVTMPSATHNLQVAAGQPIHWVVVPRLLASGFVRCGNDVYPLHEAPSYHDHNWGRFEWGQDFSWTWGFCLPAARAQPWSMVSVHLTDRMQTKALWQALLLWKDQRLVRLLHGRELRIHRRGRLRPSRVLKLPRVMSLVAPATLVDVPEVLTVSAQGDGDTLEYTFTSEHMAQLIIPNDHDFGVTIINEVSGHVRLRGHVRAEPIELDGPGVFEFLGR